MGVSEGEITGIYTITRTFLISPLLILVRAVSAASQSKSLPVSGLLLEKYSRQVRSKVATCLKLCLSVLNDYICQQIHTCFRLTLSVSC